MATLLTEERTPRRATPSAPRPAGPRRRVSWWVYVFVLPTVVLFGMYTVWPSISSIFYSMLEWRGLGVDRTFTGLANYERALADPLFWRSVGVTMLIIAVTVPVRVALALVLAIMLNNPKLPLATLLRTAFFIPVVATTAIVGIVMGFVLDPSSGPVNALLELVGLTPIDFLGSSDTALQSVMAVHIWKWLGITLIYWLAALQTVPLELYEAAEIDGAGTWGRFRHITLPLLMPFVVIITLLTVVETMQIFDLVLTMTGGGPFFSTLVTEVYIYEQAFAAANPNLGYAATLGVMFGILTVIVVGTMLLLARLARARQEARR
ncbi:carbohydrate ABC transporter permease [Ruania alba]|uniref:Carbohydrate ABC transporter membrane protein 1, CUT1 family n=1 Tax=Ruania alba TaxID=648782 RepID=A0A1H5HLW2_9MICO|nr:sugar ABC transporter permease [Ruania alba]SEE29006.1 carbohydrate ABC transporter membrane protein 1, CUT1 family [Ruania alba]